MLVFWRHISEIGAKYHVDPLIFAVLYLAHHPLFWGTMAWLVVRVRAKKPTVGVIMLGVFFWFLPYTYIFVFGRGLPWWAYALAGSCAAFGGVHAVRNIRRKLRPPTASS